MNVFMFVIVIIALAGIKAKIDMMDMMIKMKLKKEHYNGLPRVSRDALNKEVDDIIADGYGGNY